MKKSTSLCLFILLAFVSTSARAQTPARQPAAQRQPQQQDVQPADESEVVRINTNLIQLDVTVTDKHGKVVTNLKPEDFEVFVNGKPQPITNFSFVTIEPQPAGQPASSGKTTRRDAPLSPPVRLRPEQVNRTIALVIDDLSLSFVSMNYARQALKKFVDEQMQPGDLVAIVRVGKNIGALQQFTSDKQQLYDAIERTKYNPAVGRFDAFAALGSEDFGGNVVRSNEQGNDVLNSRNLEDLRGSIFVNAAVAATDYVVRGMRGLPGRKAVMLLSEGFELFKPGNPPHTAQIRESIHSLIDSAHRSGVVIYTMDPRGLQTLGLNASDDITLPPTSENFMRGRINLTPAEIQGALRGRGQHLINTQSGLIYLAEQAGGFAIYNNNDLSGGIRKALDDQKSYYLIGYQPDASTFDPAQSRFNQLKIKVKRSDLKVRYRSGFFGVKDEDIKPPAQTPQRQVFQALTSPFGSGDINLRLTPLFGNDEKAGSFVRSLVHIPTKDLTFTDRPDGQREAVINVVAYLFGDNGGVVNSVGETHKLTLTESLYQRSLSSGLVYSLNVPIKKGGGYQLRVAVRDDKAQKVGTASQFITIPNIGQGRLALSGISLSSYDPRMAKEASSAPSGEAVSGNALLTQAAERRFRVGHVLQFAYAIYNARLDKVTQQPQLTTQIKLYRDGKEIFAGKETIYDAKGQADKERLMVGGALQLGGLEEGEYVLQVIVSDKLAREKQRTTANWTDFEVSK